MTTSGATCFHRYGSGTLRSGLNIAVSDSRCSPRAARKSFSNGGMTTGTSRRPVFTRSQICLAVAAAANVITSCASCIAADGIVKHRLGQDFSISSASNAAPPNSTICGAMHLMQMGKDRNAYGWNLRDFPRGFPGLFAPVFRVSSISPLTHSNAR